MFSLDDTTQTLAELRTLQRRLEAVEDRRTGLVQATVQFGVAAVRERIQQRGQNASGETMLSSSAKRVGRYSTPHGTTRERAGLRTDIIDLTLSGELLGESGWSGVDLGDSEWGAGFRDSRLSDRADYVEDLFGPVFALSESEEQETADYFSDAVENLMSDTR